MTDEREKLERAIAAMEAQRATLGDGVVDVSVAAMREKLTALDVAAQAVPQRKQITILFADVSGFTAMSEMMDAEDVNDTMNALWARIDGAITAHSGTIDKHIGDAVMALFGAPVAREDDPERAIRAALAMQTELAAFRQAQQVSLRMRIGINTGPVLLDQVGTTFEYTAIGDTVNLASRLEHAAPVGSILVSHDTYRHVRGIFRVQPLEPIQVKGKSKLVQVYVVHGIKPRAFRVPTRGVEGVETVMIGRDAELEHLQNILHTVLEDNQTRMVTIVGDAGVGKSRLLHEFENWVDLLPTRVLHFKARASQQTSSTPYYLIRELFTSHFEIRSSDSADEAQHKLEQGIIRCMDADAQMKAHFVGHLIGLGFSQSPHLQGILSDARQIRDRAFHYVTQFFAAATSPPRSGGTERRPAILLLDDLHWADSGSLELIEHLVRECRQSPVLIVALARPEFFEQQTTWIERQPHHTRLDLQPLSAEDSHHLIDEILRKVKQIPPDLRALIVRGAEGNPFYTEELIKMLVDDGVIVKGKDQWTVESERLASARVPPTLTGVLQARLDGLPLLERETLQQAAVIGRVFWDGAVGCLIGEGADRRAGVDESLAALRDRELVFGRQVSTFAEEQEFIFKHAILHNVAYESVLKRQRRTSHAQVADWLSTQSGERSDEYAGLIGEHYERAGERRQAAEWYTRAGRQAQDTYAPYVAVAYYRKALTLLSDGDSSTSLQVELYQGLGQMLLWQTQFDEAADAYAAMQKIAETVGEAAVQARAWEGLSLVQRRRGDYRAGLENARKAEEFAIAAGKPARETLARVLCNTGWIFSGLGEAEKALSLGERALTLSTELDAQRTLVDSLHLLGWVYQTMGRYEQATHCFERALALGRELGDRMSVGRMLNNLAIIALKSRRDYRKAEELYQEALTIAREGGHRYYEIVTLQNLGGVRVLVGDHQAAEEDLCQVVLLAEEIGWGGLSATYSFLAQACLGQGKTTEALEVAKRALALAQETEVQEDLGEAYRVLGLVLADPSTPESIAIEKDRLDIRICFANSLQVYAEAGMEDEKAQTLRAWGRYEVTRGNRVQGEKMEQEAQEILTQLGIEWAGAS